MDPTTKKRNALLMLITGIILVILSIYLLVSEFQNENPTWYYWIGLMLVGDIFIIAGIRQIKKTE